MWYWWELLLTSRDQCFETPSDRRVNLQTAMAPNQNRWRAWENEQHQRLASIRIPPAVCVSGLLKGCEILACKLLRLEGAWFDAFGLDQAKHARRRDYDIGLHA